jgi:hypothetical protein
MYPWRTTQRRAVIRTASIPAPIGGLNARDSVAAMAVTDALTLRNWFPFPYAVAMRKGWQDYTTGLATSTLPTVATYSAPSGGQSLIAFSGGKIYVIAAPGPAPSALKTGLANDYWQTTMFVNAGGTYLYAVNGADDPQVYDGVTFTSVVQNSPPTGFQIQGVDPKTFIHVALHQRRLWFVIKDSMSAWYLPVDQIGGIAAEFPVGQLFKRGGFLMAVYPWTLDSGTGMTDHLAFFSSRGEIAIYSGTDVDSADTWSLEGVFDVGAPVGRRCACKYGGDLLILTTDGITPLSKAVQSTRVNTSDNLTDKIQHTISALVSLYKALPGWEIFQFPNENQIWLLVPVPNNIAIYAMNTITGAWAQFDNMAARSLCLLGENPVFIRNDGKICKAWTGYFDNVAWDAAIGDRIDCEALTAYNYFEAMGVTKRWTMCRPIFQSGTVPPSAIRLEIDFAVVDPITIDVIPPISQDYVWDDAEWDAAYWDQEFSRFRRWQSVEGMGYAAALHIRVLQDVETLWVATDYVFELGATI